MTRREVKKEIMRFVRREVKEKTADWGELRRVKRHVILKKGLPNVPNLVLQSDSGLSYLVIIQWRKELRLYLFDSDGKILHGQSFFPPLQDVSKDIRSMSKKIARYPKLEKVLTLAEQSQQLDKRFHQVWLRLARLFRISKRNRRKRPLIKCIHQKADGIFGTRVEKDFIHVPYQSSELRVIFTYYSLFFFVPHPFRQNEDIAEAIAFKVLTSIKQFGDESPDDSRNSSNIFRQLDPWNNLTASEIMSLLKKMAIYNETWLRESDFLALVNCPVNLVRNPSRQNLPKIFCEMFSLNQNEVFLTFANILGLPFGFECHIPSNLSEKESFIAFFWLKNWQFSKFLSYFQEKRLSLAKGHIRAMEEALNYQYTTVLKIELIPETSGTFEMKNNSDLPVILTRPVQVFPDGSETEASFQEVTIPAQSKITLDLNSFKILKDFPIRFQYILTKSPDDVTQPIFTGTLVI